MDPQSRQCKTIAASGAHRSSGDPLHTLPHSRGSRGRGDACGDEVVNNAHLVQCGWGQRERVEVGVPHRPVDRFSAQDSGSHDGSCGRLADRRSADDADEQ